MFCITHSDPSAFQLRNLIVWPDDIKGNRYSWQLNINVGRGDQDLMPTIMDIVGTICPFVDTSKFKHEHLNSINVTNDGVVLSFSESGTEFADDASVDFVIPLAILLDVFDVSKLTLNICLYRSAENGDTELSELYEIAFDEEDDAAKVSIITGEQKLDAFLTEEDLCFSSSYTDFDEKYEEEEEKEEETEEE